MGRDAARTGTHFHPGQAPDSAAPKAGPRPRCVRDGGDVLLALDTELRYIHWNRAAECLTGLPAAEVLGRSLYEVFPDAAGSAAEALYLDVLRTRRSMGMVTQFGDTRYEVSAFPVSAGVVVIAREIAARDAHAAGREGEPLAPPAPPQAAVAVVNDTGILAVNTRFADMFGCAGPDEAVGTSLLGFICPDHRGYVAALIRNVSAIDPSGVDLNLRARRTDGSSFPVTVWGCRVPLPEGMASAIFFADRRFA